MKIFKKFPEMSTPGLGGGGGGGTLTLKSLDYRFFQYNQIFQNLSSRKGNSHRLRNFNSAKVSLYSKSYFFRFKVFVGNM